MRPNFTKIYTRLGHYQNYQRADAFFNRAILNKSADGRINDDSMNMCELEKNRRVGGKTAIET